MGEIDKLRQTVKELASMIRTDRKVIKATQAFAATLADNLDTLEESLVMDLAHERDARLALASDTGRIFQALSRAALDHDR